MPDRDLTDVTDLGFAAAAAELDRILAELEREAVDVDVLASKVARASALIRHCRARIADARVTVRSVVAELDGADDAATAGAVTSRPAADDDEPF